MLLINLIKCLIIIDGLIEHYRKNKRKSI